MGRIKPFLFSFSTITFSSITFFSVCSIGFGSGFNTSTSNFFCVSSLVCIGFFNGTISDETIPAYPVRLNKSIKNMIFFEKQLILMGNQKIANQNIKDVKSEKIKVKTWFCDKDLSSVNLLSKTCDFTTNDKLA